MNVTLFLLLPSRGACPMSEAVAHGRAPSMDTTTGKTSLSLGPDEAGDYLTKMNFRGIVEYLSAEVITSRPEDPILFLRDLLDNKIAERHGIGFEVSTVSDYLQAVYAEVEDHADEYGRIQNKTVKAVTMNAAEEIERLASRGKKWEAIFAGLSAMLSTLEPVKALDVLLEHAAALVEADRAVMFSYHEMTEEMVVAGDDLHPEIRIAKTRGLVGAVMASGKLLNVRDAYSDPQFDRTYDVKAGYKTNTALALPVRDGSGQVLGVLLLLNKRHSVFTAIDEEFVTSFASLAGLALANTKEHERGVDMNNKLLGAMDALRDFQTEASTTKAVINVLTGRLPMIVPSEHCSVYLVDHTDRELYTYESDLKVPFGLGVVGTAAASNEVINVSNALKDPRCKDDDRNPNGSPLRTTLAVPVVVQGVLIAVVHLINKACGVFTADDEEVVRRLLAVVGPMIRATQLNQQGGFLGNGMNNEDLKKDPQHTSILEQFPRRDDDSED